ncbi:MAG: polysaccharide biosynthesis tyrosine autokinase [Fuerstiella sp.]
MNNQPQGQWSTFDAPVNEDDQGLDIWGFLQRRKAFVIVLAIIGSGLGYLHFKRETPRFRSTSMLQVIRHASDPRVETMLAEQNLEDAQYQVTSRLLLESCYKKHGLQKLSTFGNMSEDSALRKIASMITTESPAPNILTISCEGNDGADTLEIANAVADEYIAHQKSSYEDALGKLKDLLSATTGQLEDDIDSVEEAYREFDKSSQLDFDGQNPHKKVLGDLQARISGLVIKETELQSELVALEKERANAGERDALLMLIGKQANHPVNEPGSVEDAVSNARNLFQALFPLVMEEAILSEEVGPGHPKLVALRKRIELTKKHFDTLAGMDPKEDPSETPANVPDFLTVYLNSLKKELAVNRQTQDDLRQLAAFEENEAMKLRSDEHKRRDFERKLERLTSVRDDIQEQFRNAELPTNQLGGVTATVLNRARHGELVYPKLSQFLGIGAFLGGFVGLILGYIVEAADRSFRKPEEIIREFGIPILGHIPYIQEQKLREVPKDAVVDRTVISLHLPRSRPAEAYRSVRTAVCFAQGDKHKVIQVTSPAAGDGKSTLAMNFACSLAQSGKKTIIVESDFRRPKVHKLTGVDNTVGIVDVLRGQAELLDAIQDTELEGFYVLPCGRRPKNPSELLTRPEYEDLLNILRERFEYVIVDTPPVLVVTDPCSVAPRVDGVLLCVRLSRHTREFGRRSLEQLRDVGARMSGIVVNGVEEADAYGYGNYKYSDYRYRYKDYNYKYGYGDRQNEAYFAENESSTEEPTPQA